MQVLDSSFTPNTKSNFAANVSSGGVTMELFRDLAPRRGKIRNCTRQLILNKTPYCSCSLNRRSVKKDRSSPPLNILVHYKTSKCHHNKPPPETVRLVLEFYNKNNASLQKTYKVSQRPLRCVPLFTSQSLEITLKKAFDMFKLIHPTLKICCQKFESVRPMNICLTRSAKWFTVLLYLLDQH